MTKTIMIFMAMLSFSTVSLAMNVDVGENLTFDEMDTTTSAFVFADDELEQDFTDIKTDTLAILNLRHRHGNRNGARRGHRNRRGHFRGRSNRMQKLRRRHRRTCHKAGVDKTSYASINAAFTKHFTTMKPVVDAAKKSRKAWRASVIDAKVSAALATAAAMTLSTSMSKVIEANKTFVGTLVKSTFKADVLKFGLRCINTKLRIHRMKARRKARHQRRQKRRNGHGGGHP